MNAKNRIEVTETAIRFNGDVNYIDFKIDVIKGLKLMVTDCEECCNNEEHEECIRYMELIDTNNNSVISTQPILNYCHIHSDYDIKGINDVEESDQHYLLNMVEKLLKDYDEKMIAKSKRLRKFYPFK